MDHQVRVFREGNLQLVEVPREYAFAGETAIAHREGQRLIYEPEAPPKSLHALLDSWTDINEFFPEIVDLPPDDVVL